MIKSVLKKFVTNIYWSVYGRKISNPILPSYVKSILFVCKGNICRSPFAEHFASKYLSASNPISYYSAGIYVDYPKPPPIDAIVSARNFGIDLNDHRSRQINYNMMETNDLIITMETSQYRFLEKIFPEFRNKIFLLPLFRLNNRIRLDKYNTYNIEDPYGKNISAYDSCYANIEDCIEDLVSLIIK